MAKNRTPRGQQEDLPGMEKPKAIQAIDNACDELFDISDSKKTLKERYEKAEINVMGLMRAAGRVIYKYRDRTIRVDSKEHLKIQAPKKPRTTKSRIGRED